MNRGTVDLTGRRLVLNEDFKIANLSGPGAFKSISPDWFTGNPPWPFGQENWQTALTNPGSAPYSLDQNGLSITASKQPDGSWNSGLICSVSDPQGSSGFALLPGDYIEAVIRLPNDAGLWPSFWFNSLVTSDTLDDAIEVDAFEVPNDNTIIFQTSIHNRRQVNGVWNELPGYPIQATPLETPNFQFSDFRAYGFRYGPDAFRFAIDREIWLEVPVPPLLPLRPMGIIVALAFGGGFSLPVDAGPFVLTVKSIQVWRPV